MAIATTTSTDDRMHSDWVALARDLGPRFAARAAAHDAADSFVADNYRELRERRERLFRDVQGPRYHPLREHAQRLYSGRVALGVDVNA